MAGQNLRAIDLFCGCGGLTEGLKQAGFHVIAAIDNDPLAIDAYRLNHKEVDLWSEDIRGIDPYELMENLELGVGELDLLAGCPPCQGFSRLRTLNGSRIVDDQRNDLLFTFAEFINVFQPKAIMMENVPGLYKDDKFQTFCSQIKELGYNASTRILDVADYSVPQHRKRLIYMAGKGFCLSFAPTSTTRKTVRQAIGELAPAGNSGDWIHDLPENRTSRIIELISRIPHDGGSRSSLPKEFWLDCHKRCNGFKDVYGRMTWDKPSPTITGGCFNPSKGRFLHPEENRAITIREAALLQGFCINYKFPEVKNKSALATIIGNALPPPFISAHASLIAQKINDRM